MSTFFIENRQGRREHTFYRGGRKTYRKTLPNGDPLPFEGKPISAFTVESETTIFKFWIWPETDQDFKLHPDDVAEIHPQYVRFRTGRVFRGRGEYVLCDPGEGVDSTEKLSRLLLTQRAEGNKAETLIQSLSERVAAIAPEIDRLKQQAEMTVDEARHEYLRRIKDAGLSELQHAVCLEYMEGVNQRETLKRLKGRGFKVSTGTLSKELRNLERRGLLTVRRAGGSGAGTGNRHTAKKL